MMMMIMVMILIMAMVAMVNGGDCRDENGCHDDDDNG